MPSGEFSSEMVLVNEYGLHLRPSGKFVTVASRFVSAVYVSVGGEEEVDGKSLISLTTQAAERGTKIRVRTVGDDAREALDALVRLVTSGFTDMSEAE